MVWCGVVCAQDDYQYHQFLFDMHTELYAIDLVRLSELSICHRIMHNQITNERSIAYVWFSVPFHSKIGFDMILKSKMLQVEIDFGRLRLSEIIKSTTTTATATKFRILLTNFIYFQSIRIIRYCFVNANETEQNHDRARVSMMMSKMSPLRFGPKLTHCKPNETIYVLFFRRCLLLVLFFFSLLSYSIAINLLLLSAYAR